MLSSSLILMKGKQSNVKSGEKPRPSDTLDYWVEFSLSLPTLGPLSPPLSEHGRCLRARVPALYPGTPAFCAQHPASPLISWEVPSENWRCLSPSENRHLQEGGQSGEEATGSILPMLGRAPCTGKPLGMAAVPLN